MGGRSRNAAWAVLVAGLLAVGTAWGTTPSGEPMAGEHVDAHGEHAIAHGEHAGVHGDAHGGHHEWNLYYGMISEKQGAEPSLLWRPEGMPPPFLGMLLNYGILFWLLYRFGKKPIGDALTRRKENITRGMDEAARMKAEAEERLAEYEEKLATIDDEVERMRTEMREAAERERERILAEARERRERMERDARLLVEQELEAARANLMRDTVRAAVKSAEEKLAQVGGSEHQRLSDEYVAGIKSAMAKAGRA